MPALTGNLRPSGRGGCQIGGLRILRTLLYGTWRIENSAHPAVRNAECPGDGGTSHATTSHEVDQIAIEGILISHVARQFG